MSRFAPITIVLLVLLSTALWYAQPSRVPESAGGDRQDQKAEATLTTSEILETSNDPSSDGSKDGKSGPGSVNEHSAEDNAPGTTAAKPEVQVEETVHDFGVLPRFTNDEHTFVIRNTGNAPLKLEKGPSSCSCTLIGLEQAEIPPGGKAEIRLEWTLKFKEGPFLQSAMIYTNDPNRKELEFIVQGLTENRFTLSNGALVFHGLAPTENAMTQETIVYSRTWKHIQDVEIETIAEIPGMKIETEPPSEQELTSLKARSGKKVRVTIPAGLEKGNYTGQIHLKSLPPNAADPSQKSEEEELEPEIAVLNIQAAIKKPGVKFFSPNIDGFGAVKLGAVSAQDGSELIKLNFRVDQGDTPWKVKEISAWPEFIETKVETLDQEIGLFQLQIQIPPGIPPGNYYGQEIGRIVITSDHPLVPRIPSNQSGLWLDFHVE